MEFNRRLRESLQSILAWGEPEESEKAGEARSAKPVYRSDPDGGPHANNEDLALDLSYAPINRL